MDFVEKKIIEDKNFNPKCKACFCNDLCVFVLLKVGHSITTCKDWQNRVRKVIDREIEKSNSQQKEK